MSEVPKIFLSFASEDQSWVDMFTQKAWFAQQIGNVKIENYLAGDKLEFGELGRWVDERIDEATVVVAFISEYYRDKQWTNVESEKALTTYQRGRLIFVPIMMDVSAKAWWAEQKERGRLKTLPNDYMYSDFTDANGSRVRIAQDDAVQDRIGKLARAIKAIIFSPAKPISSLSATSSAPTSNGPAVVVLGHPTNRFAEDVAAQAEMLAEAMKEEGLVVHQWKDGWLRNTDARGQFDWSLLESAVFVQALAGGEASEQIIDLARTGKRLRDAGVADASVVLWLPRGQSDPDFEKSAAAQSDALKDLGTLRTTPSLRTDTPHDLAIRLKTILRPSPPHDDPVLQIETIGNPEGTKLDAEARRLSQELSQMFGNIVNGVVTTESSSPWPFWDQQFKAQIALIPGSRAIVAVHDLDVTPSPDMVANRKRIEMKFQRMQDFVRQSEAASKLKFFWAALLYKNASALPFARYPFDGRFKDWRLLGFERTGDGSATGQPVRPDPASLGVFRAELSEWAAT